MIHPDRLRMMGKSAQPAVNQDSRGHIMPSAPVPGPVPVVSPAQTQFMMPPQQQPQQQQQQQQPQPQQPQPQQLQQQQPPTQYQTPPQQRQQFQPPPQQFHQPLQMQPQQQQPQHHQHHHQQSLQQFLPNMQQKLAPPQYQFQGPPMQNFQTPQLFAQPGVYSSPAGIKPANQTFSIPGQKSAPICVGDWIEYKDPTGKAYYYNKLTKATQWTKPTEMLTPDEKRVAATTSVWVTYKDAQGKEYYYNKNTKVSVWEKPDELLPKAPVSTPKLTNEGAPAVAPNSITFVSAQSSSISSSISPSSSSSSSSSAITTSTPALADTASTPAPISTSNNNSSSSNNTIATPNTSSATTLTPSDDASSSMSADDAAAAAARAVAAEAELREKHRHKAEKSEQEKERERVNEIAQRKAAIEAARKAKEEADIRVTMDPLIAAPMKSNTAYQSLQEAEIAFNQLLVDLKIPANTTWEKALPKIVHDKRYSGLKRLADRKRIFAVYIEERTEMDEIDREKLALKIRSDYMSMLRDCADITVSMRYTDIAKLLTRDPRFGAVEESRERERLFYEHMDKVEDELKEKQKKERAEKMKLFEKSLIAAGISADAQWREWRKKIDDQGLDESRRLCVFEDIVSRLRKEEQHRTALVKEERRKIEREQRASFRTLLEESFMSEKGELHLRTIWREFTVTIGDDARYIALAKTSSSEPQKLFDDFCDELENRLNTDRKALKKVLKETEITIKGDWRDLFASLSAHKHLRDVEPSHLRSLIFEYLDAATSKERLAAKKLAKYEDAFRQTLQTKMLSVETPWGAARHMLESHSSYQKLAEKDRIRIFESYIKGLADSKIPSAKTNERDGEARRDSTKSSRSTKSNGHLSESDVRANVNHDDNKRDNSKRYRERHSSSSSSRDSVERCKRLKNDDVKNEKVIENEANDSGSSDGEIKETSAPRRSTRRQSRRSRSASPKHRRR